MGNTVIKIRCVEYNSRRGPDSMAEVLLKINENNEPIEILGCPYLKRIKGQPKAKCDLGEIDCIYAKGWKPLVKEADNAETI